MVSGTISLLYSRFFSPFPHGTCSLSVSWEYLALPDGAGRFPQGFSDLAVLRVLLQNINLLLQDYHLLRYNFSAVFAFITILTLQPYNPTYAVTYVVWAFSRSLAATWEIIIIFFSSAYLDVSVQRVSQNCLDKSRLRPLVGVRFQVLFTSLFGILFTFPSQY